jgi:aspartyl-tRNA(Asn)/glutamyl-tRNA(Gln) amidotransferase subunit A
MNPTSLTLTEAAHLLSTRAISSLELTRAHLERIAALEPRLHAFLHVDADSALAQARAADARRAAGEDSPLLGIPLAVKDVLALENMPCTCGSKILEGFVPPFTATSVQRLIDAGMVVLGKTNTDEFAMGSSTENSAYGVTHNPWDETRVPGGSSGGSAAAVAAHLAPVALGTDTGGSVRQPASFCGVTGLKPTYGSVSRYGLVAYGSSLDSVGAFGRSAQDVALVYAAMAGHDPLDSTSHPAPAPRMDLDNGSQLRGVRIGVPREYFIKGLQAQVESAVRAAIEQMQALGAEIHEISLPHTSYALPVYYLIAPAEASAGALRWGALRAARRCGNDVGCVYQDARGAFWQ